MRDNQNKNGKSIKDIGILPYLLTLVVLMIGVMFLLGRSDTKTLQYYEVIQYFEQGKVKQFDMNISNGQVIIVLKDKKEPIMYKTPHPALFIEDINDVVKKHNKEHPDDIIKYDYKKSNQTPAWIISALPSTILLLASIGLFVFFMNRSEGGGGIGKIGGFGKAKFKRADFAVQNTTFADVAGADEEKEELAEIIEFLKYPEKFNSLGARIPKGVLLMGPPGTGKTLLARAVAGEAKVPFLSISGSDFVEMFVGVGASRVRDVFEQAKKESPCIIFIDEIDAVGRHRGAGVGGGHDEREQTLNQLLVEMDGFSSNTNVIVIAATNRKDILDPALLRPGRFDRQVYVGYPDIKGREEILKVHTRNKSLAPDVDLRTIAKKTAGFVGADLANLVNEAAILSAKKNQKAITAKDIEESTIKVIAGPEKRSRIVTDRDKRLTAYHEAGHALCTYYSPTQDAVHEVSIIQRGMAGGFTLSLPEHDKSYITKKEMFEGIIVLLGGRVAEQLVLEDISSGASNDIERATGKARNMVTRYGFSDKIGPIVYGNEHDEVFLGRDFAQNRNYSEQVASEIDSEIRTIIRDAYDRSTEIINNHINKLHKIAKYLFEKENINEFTFKKLMEEDDFFPVDSEVIKIDDRREVE